MKFINNLLLLSLFVGFSLTCDAAKRALDDQELQQAKRQKIEQKAHLDLEKTQIIECSDGKRMHAPVRILLGSPFFEKLLSTSNAPENEVTTLPTIDMQTMRTVLEFMRLKFINGDADKAIDDYINNMSVDGEHEAVFEAARYLKLTWLQKAMINAGFPAPVKFLSMKDFSGFGQTAQTQVPSLQTYLCWELAKICQEDGSLEDEPRFIELPENLITRAHVLHAIAFGVKNGQPVPSVALLDIINIGVIHLDIKFEAHTTDEEIIDYLVSNNSEDVVEDIYNFYVKYRSLNFLFDPCDLLLRKIESLSPEDIKTKFDILKGLSDKQSALKFVLRFVYATKMNANLDGLECLEFIENIKFLNTHFRIEEGSQAIILTSTEGVNKNKAVDIPLILWYLPLLEPFLEKKIVHLVLEKIQDISIPESLLCLKSLRELQLSHCNLDCTKMIDKQLGIERLALHNNNCEKIPDFVVKLKSLKVLELSGYSLENLPSLKHLKNLSKVELFDKPKYDDSEVWIESLPETLKNILPKGCEICLYQHIKVSDDLKSFFKIQWKIDKDRCSIQ